MKNLVKKIMAVAICVVVLTVTMGMTAYAYSLGRMKSEMSGNIGTAILLNDSDGARYCQVFIYQGSTLANSKTKVSSRSKVVAGGDLVSTSGTITKAHAKGVGEIYHSTNPVSGKELGLQCIVK